MKRLLFIAGWLAMLTVAAYCVHRQYAFATALWAHAAGLIAGAAIHMWARREL